ncbi:MAG: tRNA (adenosine(37)-N6)-dimethylallyltransferase MiaA [Spirochaetaceae bacterium]|nr:MAG: tRNA (adenosine(37)-N6)-dimethylallyltransferase MiaA [Spirochaetaceae bacterium]
MKQVLLLFGATAVGKSAALADLARLLPARGGAMEVISADSRQVYRGMDIGTAKPDRHERALCPHHLIDILDPRDPFDVGSFVLACDRLVREIRERSAIPVVSGGTAFYLKGFLCGLPGTPRASLEVRALLEERLKQEGLGVLRRELEQLDPASAARIGENDQYRILRGLEVYHVTGKPRSSFTDPREPRPGLNAVVLGLQRDRKELYGRIDARVAAMFDAGLPREVEALYEAGYRPGDPGLRTIGYREFFELGGPPPWSRSDLSRIQTLIAGNTRRYARRQELFFRKLPQVRWVEADDREALLRVADGVMQVFSK